MKWADMKAAAFWTGVSGLVTSLIGNTYIAISIVRSISRVPLGTTGYRPYGLELAVAIIAFAVAGMGIMCGLWCVALGWRRPRNWVIGCLSVAAGAAACPLMRLVFQMMCESRNITMGD
jgi:hypothetical protein